MATREESRARANAAILAAARTQIAEHGGGGLSMRAIAREIDMVSSAVYRYFPTRDALLTAMIVESYGNLDDALGRARGTTPRRRWASLGNAFRAWGTRVPHEFQLIYGTPIPGYVAPPETIPAAAAVARHFLLVGGLQPVPAYDDRTLRRQLAVALELVPEADASGAAAVLAEMAALVGTVGMELAGHFVGSADPADRLYAALLARQADTLDLA